MASTLGAVVAARPALAWYARRSCAALGSRDPDESGVCALACRQGVSGDDGCLGAALRALESDETQARAFFTAACRAREVQGCWELQVLDDGARPRTFATKQQVDWAEQACALGDVKSCERTAEAWVGGESARALSALVRRCELLARSPEEKARCKQDLTALGEESARLERACAAEDVEACQKRAELFLPHVPALSVQALAAECTARGVDALFVPAAFELGKELEWYSGPLPDSGAEYCGFELLRERRGSGRAGGPAGGSTGSAVANDADVQVLDVKVTSGSYDSASAAATSSIDWNAIGNCYQAVLHFSPVPTGRVRARVVVDRFGKSWRSQASLVDFKAAGLSSCISNVLSRARWPRRADDIAALELFVLLSPRPASTEKAR